MEVRWWSMNQLWCPWYNFSLLLTVSQWIIFFEICGLVSWLKVDGPSVTNKAKIHDYMENTFPFPGKTDFWTLHLCVSGVWGISTLCGLWRWITGRPIISTVERNNDLLTYVSFRFCTISIVNIKGCTLAWRRGSSDDSTRLYFD